ncbi:MAG TPA: hypothetical protein VMS38_34535 [Pseudorhodoferax sp.]|nr:hypothetical protein [Pseudorhodoferax sp.]
MLLASAFYVYMQDVVQHRLVLDTAQVQPPPAGMVLDLERNDGADRRFQYLAGSVVQADVEGPWLRPSVLIMAPDGQATEFRANLRGRENLAQLPPPERQQRMARFEVRVMKRYFPSGEPLKIVLGLTQQGQRIYVDTGNVVAGVP